MSIKINTLSSEPYLTEWNTSLIEPFSHMLTSPSTSISHSYHQIMIDLIELQDQFYVYIDAPGTHDEDIELSISKHILDVKINRKIPIERQSGIRHRVERVFNEKHRRIRLPSNLDTDNPIANLSNGILTIIFPKIADSISMKKIPIQQK